MEEAAHNSTPTPFLHSIHPFRLRWICWIELKIYENSNEIARSLINLLSFGAQPNKKEEIDGS